MEYHSFRTVTVKQLHDLVAQKNRDEELYVLCVRVNDISTIFPGVFNVVLDDGTSRGWQTTWHSTYARTADDARRILGGAYFITALRVCYPDASRTYSEVAKFRKVVDYNEVSHHMAQVVHEHCATNLVQR